jgi:uncharacterized membrane protein
MKAADNGDTVVSRGAGRSTQAGLLLAAAAAAKSFERTLMPRSTRDQGVVTGLAVSLTYATTALFQDLIENGAAFLLRCNKDQPEDRLRRATMLADLMAMASGAIVERALKRVENESMGRAAVRSTAFLTTRAGLAGFTAGFIQDLLDVLDTNRTRMRSNRRLGVAVLGGGIMALIADYRRRRLERRRADDEATTFRFREWNVRASQSLGQGLSVMAALALISALERGLSTVTSQALERGLAGSPRLWRLVGHIGAIGALGGLGYIGLDRVYQDIEAGTGKLEPSFDKPPESGMVSGSAASVVPWQTLGREGRRHVLTALSRESIESVMGEPAIAEPIRVYVGLASAPTELDRLNLAMAELRRTGAFDRELLVAVSPTGTGYVNYVAVECSEFFTLGNCATVTLQYSKRPSPLSLDRVWEGRKQFRMLLAAIRRELFKIEPAKRPKLVVFGESLGAHTSQDAFLHQGTQGLEDAGVERALWVGSPHLSKWKLQVLNGARPDVDAGLVAEIDSFEELERLGSEARDALRYVMLTHHNDGVGLFGPDLVIQEPGWLGDPETRAASVPRWMRWVPIITAIQTVIDMKNAMNVVPGEFAANGHDYRSDLARFLREVYCLPCTEEQLRRVEAAVRRLEVERSKIMPEGLTLKHDGGTAPEEALPG